MECVCWSCRCSWSVCAGLVGVNGKCVCGLVGVRGKCVLVL